MTTRIVLFDRGAIQVEDDPFPHVVLDGWWPDALLANVAREFPPPSDERWHRFNNDRERKLQGGYACWGPWTERMLLEDLAAPDWLTMVGSLMGIPGPLVPGLEGGGMHMIEPGGMLGIHADFNRASNGLWRRVNCLVFLNPGWQPGMGGELELRGDCAVCLGTGSRYFALTGEHGDVDQDLDACDLCQGLGVDLLGEAVGIPPVFNRTVIFATSDRSWHGHPAPLPGDWCRRSLATYYYTAEPPPEASAPHDTIFAR